MAILQLEPIGFIKKSSIPPSRPQMKRRGPPRFIFLEIFERLKTLPKGQALKMKHNAQSSQIVHSAFHVYAKQNGYRIKLAVRDELVYVWLNEE